MDGFSLLAHQFEKIDHIGMNLDQMIHLAFEFRNVQAKLGRPVIEIGPFQGVFDPLVSFKQFFPGFNGCEPVFKGKYFRNIFFPEIVVEIFIQQGTVHIEQDGIDL